MKPDKDADLERLNHALTAINLIEDFAKGFNKTSLLDDWDTTYDLLPDLKALITNIIKSENHNDTTATDQQTI